MPNKPHTLELLPKELIESHVAPWLDKEALLNVRQSSKVLYGLFKKPQEAANLVHFLENHPFLFLGAETKFRTHIPNAEALFQSISYKNSYGFCEVITPFKFAFQIINVNALQVIFDLIKENKNYSDLFNKYLQKLNTEISLLAEIKEIAIQVEKKNTDVPSLIDQCEKKLKNITLLKTKMVHNRLDKYANLSRSDLGCFYGRDFDQKIGILQWRIKWVEGYCQRQTLFAQSVARV